MLHVDAVRLREPHRKSVRLIRWHNPASGNSGELPLADLINWIGLGGRAYTTVEGDLVQLEVDETAARREGRAPLQALTCLPRF
jgi:hypothetical protein